MRLFRFNKTIWSHERELQECIQLMNPFDSARRVFVSRSACQELQGDELELEQNRILRILIEEKEKGKEFIVQDAPTVELPTIGVWVQFNRRHFLRGRAFEVKKITKILGDIVVVGQFGPVFFNQVNILGRPESY